MLETKPGKIVPNETNYLDRMKEENFAEEGLRVYLNDVARRLSEDKFPITRARLVSVLTQSLNLNTQSLIERLERKTKEHKVIDYENPESKNPGRSFSTKDVLPLAAICWTVTRNHEEGERINTSLSKIVKSTQDSLGPDNFIGNLIHEPPANGGIEPRINLGPSRKRSDLAKSSGDWQQTSFEEMPFDEKVKIGQNCGVLELREIAAALPSSPDGLSSKYVNFGLAGIVMDIMQRLNGKPPKELDEIPLYAFKKSIISLAGYMERYGIENLDEFRKRPRTTIEQANKATY